MSLNVKLLRKVKKHILEEPRRFFMSEVDIYGNPGQKIVLDGIEREFPACGTAACIAGWTCLLSKKKGLDVTMFRAQELLGISERQTSKLFFDWNWPSNFKARWNKAKTVETRAKVAGERIEHLIKTGK